MIAKIILICGLLGAGILLGMYINQYFTKADVELDDYDLGWKRGYECGKINGNYMRGYWKGYDEGWDSCKCGKERKNPLDRMYEDFEKEVNNEL